MSKSLKIIQGLSKAGRIISKIVKILCIVGICLSAIGMIMLAVGAQTLEVGSVSIHGMLEQEAGVVLNEASLYFAMTAAVVFMAVEIYVAAQAEKYFENELKAGTPFTMAGAKEMLRLGIIALVTPIICQMIVAIAQPIVSKALQVEINTGVKKDASVAVGVSMIITSVIFKYGAELKEGIKG